MMYHPGMKLYVSKFQGSDAYSYSTIHELGRRTYNGFPADGGIIRETQRLATKVMKGIVLLDNDGDSIYDQATILFGATVINVFNLCGYVSVSSCLGHGNIFDGRDFKSALTVRGHRGFLVQVRIPHSFSC